MTLKKKLLVTIGCLIVILASITSVFASADADVYYECARYELTAKCDLKGDFPKDKTEVFTVVVTPDERSPQFEQSAVKIPANKSGSFGNITVDVPDVYSYVVYQEKGDNEKITYDNTTFEIVVEVITNDDGMVAEKHSITNLRTGKKVEEVRFVNIYESDSPKTDDDTNIVLWVTVLGTLVVAGIVVGGVYISERKKSKK